MKDFFSRSKSGNRGNDRSGGYRKSGRPSYGHGGDNDRPAMHSAVCSQCDMPCEVPFKPNGRKPVLCNNCFHKDGESGGANKRFGRQDRSERGSFDKPAYRSTPHANNDGIEKQLKALNEKMDQILEALLGMGEDDAIGEE